VAGKIKGELAQFREMAAFAQFGSDLDDKTKALLERGRRIVELFKQQQYQPLPVEMQAAVLYAMQQGFMDKIDVDKIKDYQGKLQEFLETRKASLLEAIRTKKAIDDALGADLKAAFEEFGQFYK
jgi:F-type H+-transporting ATPase subunit alpha